MKNFIMLVLAIIAALIVWHIVVALLGGILAFLFHIAMIALVCYLIYAAVKAVTRQKQVL